MKKKCFLIIIILSFSKVYTSEPALLSPGIGMYSVFREKYQTAEVRLEYKFKYQFHHFRPNIGIMTTFTGAVYTYLGVGLDLVLFQRVVISPNFALGYYYKGGARDLGYPLEFRSGMELGWRFCNASRLGVNFYHISNASLGKRNPGEESLVLFYAFPVGK